MEISKKYIECNIIKVINMEFNQLKVIYFNFINIIFFKNKG
jgi:hypothetical protein